MRTPDKPANNQPLPDFDSNRGFRAGMTVESVRPDEWTAAMECVLGRIPAEQRSERVRQCVDLLVSGAIDPRGVWVARDENRIVAAQVCVLLAGAACLFWLPSAAEDVADHLVRAALDGCRDKGCKIAQALPSADEEPWAAPLRRQGFRTITHLYPLKHDLSELPPMPLTPLRFVPYHLAEADAFATVLEQTYAGTLDCPELNGVRNIDEIITGHRAQGRFHADYWWLVYEGPTAVGVVMLMELPDGLTWELAYVGLIPNWRGCGHGRTLVLHAMHALYRRLAASLTLAVDERNIPARRLYQNLGFIESQPSEVLLYLW
jgi:mycothiol synthase